MKRYLYATQRSPVLRAAIRLRDLWRVEIERENTQHIERSRIYRRTWYQISIRNNYDIWWRIKRRDIEINNIKFIIYTQIIPNLNYF